MSDDVRLGLIGSGSMGCKHANYFDRVEGLRFAAAADADPGNLDKVAEGRELKRFDDASALIASGEVDAVLIATPHTTHAKLAIEALDAGLHVLVEKPIAVTAHDAEPMLAAAERHPDLVFAAMFNQRTHPVWRAVKKAIDDGRVGELLRVAWTITDWYRTDAYYSSGGWRATWRGEGGGVLLNQAPHNLDLFQWFVGMPAQVRAVVGLGRQHPIEVEDQVTALLTYPNGATGTFITGTGEAPGENRLVIVGDKATVVATLGNPVGQPAADLGGAASGGSVTLVENQPPISQHIPTSPDRFGKPEAVVHDLTPDEPAEDHIAVTRNFVDAIRRGDPLVAPGVEGVHALELGNAMLLAGLEDRPVDLPMDRAAFRAKLDELIAASPR